jgi:hypothetical protein
MSYYSRKYVMIVSQDTAAFVMVSCGLDDQINIVRLQTRKMYFSLV